MALSFGWVSAKRSLLLDQLPNQQHDNGADDGCSALAEQAAPLDAELLEEPAADKSADESHEEVDPTALSRSVCQLASYSACHDSNHD